MNIDEPGDEHIIDEDFHGAFDENLFQELVVNDILDPDLNLDIPNMEGARQGAWCSVVVRSSTFVTLSAAHH